MSTPLSRARIALRAVHRFNQGRRSDADVENGAPLEDTIAEEAEADDRLLPLLPSLKRNSNSFRGMDGESPRSATALRREAAALLRQESRTAGISPILGSAGEGGEASETSGFFAPVSDAKAITGLVTSSYLNVLLLCIPLGFAAKALHWNAYAVFGLNFLALVPLALLLGEITEDLAIRFGDVIGGLLNATFGNVVELILSLAALYNQLYDVVAMSLIGSVLSNLLLVLGCCFLFGGTQYHQQRFNVLVNKAMCSLLFLSCIAIALPTAGRVLAEHRMSHVAEENVSHYTAIMLIVLYCLYLFFQLKTHRDETSTTEEEGEKEEEVSSLSLSGSLFALTAITVIVAFASEYLTGAIESVSEASGINRAFLGLIVLPIAGNACEHITAVFVAYRNKMDLALGVALGSSIQIAIFVLPFVVLAGWAIGRPFSLAFDPLAVLILTLSVIHANFVGHDGTSNWLLGVQLIGVYILIGILYFFAG